MKVGDYVRTIKGIAKITKIDEIEGIAYTDNKNILFGVEKSDKQYEPQDIYYVMKYSPNIIDLIKIGDIVKLKELEEAREVAKDNFFNYKSFGFDTRAILTDDGYWEQLINYTIISIITVEQIEDIKYKVKE